MPTALPFPMQALRGTASFPGLAPLRVPCRDCLKSGIGREKALLAGDFASAKAEATNGLAASLLFVGALEAPS